MNQSRSSAVQRRRDSQRPDGPSLRTTIYDIIFEHETAPGLWFDIGLLVAILTSVMLVSLETVGSNAKDHAGFFWYSEWFMTILFTIEYGLRLYCVRRPLKYALSFWGIIDLLSILPTYVAAMPMTTGSVGSFVVIRSIRLLRVFRVLKLWRLMTEADELSATIWLARDKIIVFIAVVLVAVSISGTLMYCVENLVPGKSDSQFTSIPQSMYWATVTMTTVGYGDIVPKTVPGKFISAALILLGYSLIIVPSGFVAAEFTARRLDETANEPECENCEAKGQRPDAAFCYRCGVKLNV